MKHLLSLFLVILIIVLPTGCSATRKASKSSVTEQITGQTTTSTETATQNKEAVITQTNTNEQVTVSIDFTRYEFTDGTTLDEIIPFIKPDSTKPRDREITEPPNPGKGVRAITTGHIDLNKQSEQETETKATADTEQRTYLKSKSNTSSEISQQTTSTEKEKHGLIYYIGALSIMIIASSLIYFVVRFIKKKNGKI